MITALGDSRPRVARSCFVAEGAAVVGDVHLGEGSSVWYGAVVRADENGIRIGARTNIQDLCALHVDGENGLEIGEDVTIGHGAIVHGCRIADRVLVGMGAIVMNGVQIGEDSIVAAGAIVTEGTKVPARSLVLGVPAKVRRAITDEEVAAIAESAKEYVKTASLHMKRAQAQPRG
jgi:carbonic anhydrase/acetyltransferase-like protein (isoleucine patch superfamily)